MHQYFKSRQAAPAVVSLWSGSTTQYQQQHHPPAGLLLLSCRVPAYYALILRSLTVLEGLALQADPQYKLLGRAYPYIAKRLLTDPAPELRASFEDLILKVNPARTHTQASSTAAAAAAAAVCSPS